MCDTWVWACAHTYESTGQNVTNRYIWAKDTWDVPCYYSHHFSVSLKTLPKKSFFKKNLSSTWNLIIKPKWPCLHFKWPSEILVQSIHIITQEWPTPNLGRAHFQQWCPAASTTQRARGASRTAGWPPCVSPAGRWSRCSRSERWIFRVDFF